MSKYKLSRNDRAFIEENYIRPYHEYISEKQKLEIDIIECGHNQCYTGGMHSKYNSASEVEAAVNRLNRNQRFLFLASAVHAVDVAYRQCTPEQQKFMDMYYLGRRRYSSAAISESTGKSWKTIGRWRYRICEMVAEEIGLFTK